MTHMDLWNSVCNTPDEPGWLKKVEYGKRKFTSIDAYHQIRLATEVWGPVGQGWGWDPEYAYQGSLIVCELRLWYVPEGNGKPKAPVSVHAIGAAKFDDDGPKKSLTDAITKALSYLGFNADVFLGEHDNKYNAPKTAPPRQAPKPQPAPPPPPVLQDRQEDNGFIEDDDFDSMFGGPPEPPAYKELGEVFPTQLPENWAQKKCPFKKFKGITWGKLTEGSVDGRRHGYFRDFALPKLVNGQYPETDAIIQHIVNLYEAKAAGQSMP